MIGGEAVREHHRLGAAFDAAPGEEGERASAAECIENVLAGARGSVGHCRGKARLMNEAGHSRSKINSRLRCSSLRPSSFTASVSAALASGASMVPRLWARWRMIATRQLRSLAAVGFFGGRAIPPNMAGEEVDCESLAADARRAFSPKWGMPFSGARVGAQVSAYRPPY